MKRSPRFVGGVRQTIPPGPPGDFSTDTTARGQALLDALVARGRAIQARPRQLVRFTGDREVDALLNDIGQRPHAFLISAALCGQFAGASAWGVPFEFSRRFGGFEFPDLADLSHGSVVRLFTDPKPIHRFPRILGDRFYNVVRMLADRYGGDAGRLWRDRPASKKLLRRLSEFSGLDRQAALRVVQVLALEFKIPLADYRAVDARGGFEQRLVLARLRFVQADDADDAVIDRIRELHPEFPALLQLASLEVGKTWCHLNGPACAECPLNVMCPSAPA